MRKFFSDRIDHKSWKHCVRKTGCFAFVAGGMKVLPCFPKSAASSGNLIFPDVMRIPDEEEVIGFIAYNLESGSHEIWYPRSLKMKEKRMVIDFFGLKGYKYRFCVYVRPYELGRDS